MLEGVDAGGELGALFDGDVALGSDLFELLLESGVLVPEVCVLVDGGVEVLDGSGMGDRVFVHWLL